jgi:hypothetical protein
MSLANDAAVRHQIIVETSNEKAFATFVDRFGDFKPPEQNLLGVAIAETRFEPRVEGTSLTEPQMGASADGPASSLMNA